MSVTGELTTYAGRSVTLTVGVTQTGAVIAGAPADVEVTLAQTDTQKTIQVALADDTVTEADGSVTLTLPDSEAFASARQPFGHGDGNRRRAALCVGVREPGERAGGGHRHLPAAPGRQHRRPAHRDRIRSGVPVGSS